MMAKPHEIAPADCPEPFWHETHRYCPRCSWMEDGPPKAPPPPSAEEQALMEAAEDALRAAWRRFPAAWTGRLEASDYHDIRERVESTLTALDAFRAKKETPDAGR